MQLLKASRKDMLQVKGIEIIVGCFGKVLFTIYSTNTLISGNLQMYMP